MPSVADCLRQHAPAFDETFGKRLSLTTRKVLDAITRCRSGELGAVVYRCDDCQQHHWVGRSCGNRHCPNCQAEKTAAWLEKQTKRLLPVHHFLITFTVPAELRGLVRAHPRAGYDAIFNAGRETIRELASNPKWLGTNRIGFFGVLHTWGRDLMVYHPHVHFVVPGGGVSEDGSRWLSTPENFFFPEACASPIYRAKFRDLMQAAQLDHLVDARNRNVWSHDKWWEVNVKPVGNGRAVLKYLAPYVHRVAISNNRIEACSDKSVTYRYTPSKSKRLKTRTVEGVAFVSGFVQHVLPRALQKVRHYGWMGANSKVALEQVRWLVWLFWGRRYWLGSGVAGNPQREPPPKRTARCPKCGRELRVVRISFRNCALLVTHALPYRDSG
jgi:hypothetical protein